MTNSDVLKLVASDRTADGILIHFSDGLSVFYHTQFLYDVRDQGGNKALPMDENALPMDEIDDAQEIN